MDLELFCVGLIEIFGVLEWIDFENYGKCGRIHQKQHKNVNFTQY
jgi:hypothetical protein